MTSQNLSFDAFIEESLQNQTMTLEDIINEIVGEINILLTAPEFHIQSVQFIPDEVLCAYQKLLTQGFTKCIITDEKIKRVLEKWIALELIDKESYEIYKR